MEQDIPDYDMDAEDEEWMKKHSKNFEITELQFEEMMDRLEKGSGQQVHKRTWIKWLWKGSPNGLFEVVSQRSESLEQIG